MPTKTAMDELSCIDMHNVIEILENGFFIRNRKKDVVEKGIKKGNKVINVVIVDMNNSYKLIHAGKFTLSKKFKKMARNKNGL